MDFDTTLLDPALTLPLNNAHTEETSELDLPGIRSLLDISFHSIGIDRGATAFLIALDEKAPYQNPNFAWFLAKHESFVYVDRIIVASTLRGKGVARHLYEDLFLVARRVGQRRVVCEVNIDPPNAASLAFHGAMGFQEVGQATLYGGAKTVRYLAKTLS